MNDDSPITWTYFKINISNEKKYYKLILKYMNTYLHNAKLYDKKK